MIIEQIHSIGDLLFLEPMYRYYLKRNGEKPIVPVRDHLMWLQQYIDSAIFIKESDYINRKTKYQEGILNTMHANQILRGHNMHYHGDFENCMPDKYLLAGLDPDIWVDINLNFSHKKGDELYDRILIDDYILVNENSQAGSIDILSSIAKRPVLNMNIIPGYSLIDWFKVILNADEFHTVSTSTFFLIQAIKNKYPKMRTKIFIYPRPNEDGLRGISKLKTTFEYKAMI